MAGPTHDLGYEPDTFSIKPVLAVPIAVIITGVIAYVVTWLLFANIFDPKINNPEPTFEAAAKRNAEPLNDRLGRISSTDPKAEFQQPRLEGLVQTQKAKPDPNRDYTITAEFTPMLPTKEGNSPQVHADDLRPERIKELNTTEPAPGGVPRVPIDQAIADLVKGKLLPAREGALPLDVDPNWDRPKESNGGSAKLPDAPQPAAKKEPDKKEPEKKAPAGKGDEPGKK
jgi:hypothetical protein